jgi:hypothetical protein
MIMITSILLILALSAGETASPVVSLGAQVRPGTFGSGSTPDPTVLDRLRHYESDRRLVREFLRSEQPRKALELLAPWRKELADPKLNGSMYNDFFVAYVMLGQWHEAAQIAEEEYDMHNGSKSSSISLHHVVRLSTCYYVVGRREDAYRLCEQHAALFTPNELGLYFKSYTTTPILRSNIGDALLRASASMEGADLRMYYLQLLVRERPGDAEAHLALANALPAYDLLGKRYRLLKAIELGDEKLKKQAERELASVEQQMKLRERDQGGGSQSFSITTGGNWN